MDRDGNIIRFTAEEQQAFGVAEGVDIANALAAARTSLVKAESADNRVMAMVGSDNIEAEQRRRKLIRRSSDLTLFAGGILRLCQPEMSAQLIQDLNPKL